MIRTLITPVQKIISIDIPENYIGKQIEVIAFVKDEEFVQDEPVLKKVSFLAFDLDTRGYKFNRDEANER